LLIRPATLADAPAVAGIYAHHVLHGTASFEEVPPTPAEMARRMAAVLDAGLPWLLAEEGGHALGYAYAGQLNPRSGYRHACEDSIYIRHDRAGQGVGTALLAPLMAACAARGFVRMFAIIGDGDNAGSIALHAKAGFGHAGTLRAAGFKFGRWLDVVQMQATLAHRPDLPPLPE